jgi:hypothetical protein
MKSDPENVFGGLRIWAVGLSYSLNTPVGPC